MKLIGHTLFKNEERWLWYSVSSVINYVDKLFLWDTGSTDDSFKIAEKLKAKYKDKIDLEDYGSVTSDTFYKARQEMLDKTNSDWFLVIDADEVWWEDSIKRFTTFLKNKEYKKNTESIVVPTVNLIGDIYHTQDKSAGKYSFGKSPNKLVGHYNLRAINRNIPGLCSSGIHGTWGWADKNNVQIQDRNTFELLNTPYLHMSFLQRSTNDKDVPKRKRKLKYEIGDDLPLDYYYPESFFLKKPDFIASPWDTINSTYILKALIQTPLKKIKRKVIRGKVGY